MGSQRVGHNWATFTFKYVYTHTHKLLTHKNFLMSKEKDITNKSEQIPLLTGFIAQNRKKSYQKKNQTNKLLNSFKDKKFIRSYIQRNEKIKRWKLWNIYMCVYVNTHTHTYIYSSTESVRDNIWSWTILKLELSRIDARPELQNLEDSNFQHSSL